MTDPDEPSRSDPDEPPAERDSWPVLESKTEYETGWYDGGYDLVEQPDGREKRYYWADLPSAVVIVARVEGTAAVSIGDGSRSGGDRTDDDAEPGVRSEPAATSDDRLLFVEQYRPAIRERHLELPAGIVEGGESYTEAAARELEEETGFAPTSTVLLQEYAVATGVLRHDRGVVYADGLVPGERDLDGDEFLEVTTVPVDRALERARERPANDATLSALLLAKEDGLL